VLTRLSETLAARRDASPETSYTARLFARGPDSILKKIGEESAELIMASKENASSDIVHEAADVLFHVLALLAFHGLSIADVRRELERREGTSGIEEKKSRKKDLETGTKAPSKIRIVQAELQSKAGPKTGRKAKTS
jgi:phosphoribosyl-ATP pyrophosphohydrolase